MVVSVLAASLTPPLLRVLADGYHLLVELADMGPAFQFRLLYWKKGQESRVSLTLRFWAITECPEGMHTGTAQRLFVSPSSCCGAEGPAWGGFAPTSGSLWVPRGEACLVFPHFPLWEKESSHVPQL